MSKRPRRGHSDCGIRFGTSSTRTTKTYRVPGMGATAH